jgi:hypothetical protein
MIKEKKHAFQNVDTDMLTLWQVLIPVDGHLSENLENVDLTKTKPLQPVHRLLVVFIKPPKEEHVHIVVCLKVLDFGGVVWSNRPCTTYLISLGLSCLLMLVLGI